MQILRSFVGTESLVHARECSSWISTYSANLTFHMSTAECTDTYTHTRMYTYVT